MGARAAGAGGDNAQIAEKAAKTRRKNAQAAAAGENNDEGGTG